MGRVLVIGVPRSGTTWVATLLGNTKDATYLEEPDNHLMHPFASRAKRRLNRRFYPALGRDEEAADYERLWRTALALNARGSRFGRTPGQKTRRSLAYPLWRWTSSEEIRRAFLDPGSAALKLRAAEALAVPEMPVRPSRHLVVKSVYAALSLEWIVARFPIAVVVVLRNVLNVVSSWAALDWIGRPGDDMLDSLDPVVQKQLAGRYGIPLPALNASPVARGAWLLGMLTLALEDAAKRHPDWHVVRHEDLCQDPPDRFHALSQTLGLEWTAATERLLDDLNRPGSGTERARVFSELQEIWRSRLDDDQVRDITAVLERFPLKG